MIEYKMTNNRFVFTATIPKRKYTNDPIIAIDEKVVEEFAKSKNIPIAEPVGHMPEISNQHNTNLTGTWEFEIDADYKKGLTFTKKKSTIKRKSTSVRKRVSNITSKKSSKKNESNSPPRTTTTKSSPKT